MKSNKQNYRESAEGFALITVMFLVTVIASIIGAYTLMSQTELRLVKSSRDSSKGFNAAEAGVNLRAIKIRDIVTSNKLPSGNSPSSIEDCIENSSGGSEDFACQTYELNNGFTAVTMIEEDPNNPLQSIIPPDQIFQGLTTSEYRYTVTSTGLSKEGDATSVLKLRFKSRSVPLFQFGIFSDQDLEILNSQVFNLIGPIHTNGDIYMAPATRGEFYSSGQMSSAGHLFIGSKDNGWIPGHWGRAYVWDTPNHFRELPSIERERKMYENSDFTEWNGNILLEQEPVEIPKLDTLEAFNPTAGFWKNSDLRLVLRLDAAGKPNTANSPTGIEVVDVNGNNIQTATNALNSASCSQDGYMDAAVFRSSGVDRVWDHTEYSPVRDLYENRGLVYDVENDISRPIGNTHPSMDKFPKPSGDVYDTSTRNSSWKNRGEDKLRLIRDYYQVWTDPEHTNNSHHRFYHENGGTYMDPSLIDDYTTTLEVDVRALLDCIHKNPVIIGGKSLSDDTDGGLAFHMTIDGPNSTRHHNDYAVRLRNGAVLQSTLAGAAQVKGLSIITDQRMVIWGDYNLDSDWIPSALLGDTHYILSNNWRDYKSEREFVTTKRTTDTTINAAVVTGIQNTGGSDGYDGQDKGFNSSSGGIMNFLRMSEEWKPYASSTPTTLNYKGSIVTLGEPLHNQSQFEPFYRHYSAPNRNFAYDTRFNDPKNFPPLTPVFVYVRQEMFGRDYE